MAAGLDIRLFGGLDLALNGVPLTNFVSSKAPALLAYLAVTRRTHQREALAGLLWGGLADADARNNLRQTLSSLRRDLNPFLLISRDTVAVDPDAALLLDVEVFVRHLAGGTGDNDAETRADRLQAAAALYRGDFLAGFGVRDAPEFEDWMLAQRSRFRELALHALHTLTQIHLQCGHAAAAIDSAMRLLGIDAWREEAHRQLMLALARTGQRSAALAQYETCRRILEKELGVAPSAETTALYERIRAARRQVRLPPSDTPFVGRAEELAHIGRLMADPTCRLITVSGPGGSGKTRLALEAAVPAADAFMHGACFTSLAGAGSLDVVPSTIAQALGLALSGKVDPREQLLAHLRDKELLLVLDNLEHLPGADELVGSLAQACPEVCLLVTSRARMNLHGERLVELGGLDVPPALDEEAFAGFGAVQLFLTVARTAQPAFAPNAAERVAIARICRLVDGLPLAIELAAAWVRHLSCHEIADEIERNLGFLATTQQNVPARHRSLQAAFEHSWALLAGDERRAFARLAVFRGGCDREAAVVVTGCQVPVLAALCDKSLLRRDPAGRYGLHELLRQFAESKLHDDAQSLAEARAAHCEFYMGLLSAQQDALNDARQKEARQTLAAEADNVRVAWRWAVAHQQLRRLQPGLEGLRVFLDYVGWYIEGAELFGAAAEAARAAVGDASPLYGQLLARQAWFYHRLDRFEVARTLSQRSLAIVRNARPALPLEAALCLQCLGNMSRAVGDYAQSIEVYQESLSLHRSVGNPRHIAYSLNGLAVAHCERGDFDESKRLHAEGLALRRQLGDRNGVAISLVNLGNVALAQGRYGEAQPFEREALAAFRELGYPMGEAVALNNLAFACYRLGEYAEAERLFVECITLCRELGHRYIAAHALASLGGVAGALGDFRTAWLHTRGALHEAREVGSISATLLGLVSAAVLLAGQAHHERAAEVSALVFHHPAANHETRDRAEQLLGQLAADLPALDLAAAQERGRARTLDDLVTSVLEWARSLSDNQTDKDLLERSAGIKKPREA